LPPLITRKLERSEAGMAATAAGARIEDLSFGRICAGIVEQLALGVVVCDASLRIVHANAIAAQVMAQLEPRIAPGARPSRRSRLPQKLERAVVSALRHPVPAVFVRRARVRVEGPQGRSAVDVSAFWEAGETVVVLLRLESMDSAALFALLRRKYRLSARDARLLRLLRLGRSNDQIAESCGWTRGTVKVYLHALFERFGVHSRAELLWVLDRLGKGEIY
jgi:DNA-binding CsgD family transcriptional regulator